MPLRSDAERLTEEAAAQLREDGLLDLELQCRIVEAGLRLDTITADAFDLVEEQPELPFEDQA